MLQEDRKRHKDAGTDSWMQMRRELDASKGEPGSKAADSGRGRTA